MGSSLELNVADEFRPEERQKAWKRLFEHLPQHITPQSQLVGVCEEKYSRIKDAYERAIEQNIVMALQIKNAQEHDALKYAFAQGVGFMKAKLRWVPKEYRPASPASLQQENEQIVGLINWEKGKLLELKAHLYECSPYEAVRQAMEIEVNDFIAQNLCDDAQGTELSLHDMLHLSQFGGFAASEEIYVFKAGNRFMTAPLCKIGLLSDLGLINEPVKETYKDNLTYTGHAILRKMSERPKASMAALCFPVAQEDLEYTRG